MILFKKKRALGNRLQQLQEQGRPIGFVPTMGALHEGHISLIAQSLADGNITVVSIFVNPTQFNDRKDFEKYPITIENDTSLLHNAGVHILFIPAVSEMYPEGLQDRPILHSTHLESVLEGFYRPGHFEGVTTIMHRLLSAVQPQHLYMGQKDYQQCMVVQQLIAGAGFNTSLHIVPTSREPSGLAMSSRNTRLSATGKENAKAIYAAHTYIKNNLLKLGFADLKKHAQTMLTAAGFDKIDYIEICNSGSLAPESAYNGQTKLVVLTAAFIEGVRLIDNLLLN